MNLKEHVLEEVELHEFQVRDALQCLLHTILFVRAPGPLKPKEAQCDHFSMTFPKCGVVDVDKTVDDAVERFWLSLTPAGPDLSKGWVTLSFYERRVRKSFLGLMSNEEKIAWEQWVIPILVNNGPQPVADDEASTLARQRLKEHADDTLAARLEDILSSANMTIEHIPPVLYEYVIETADKSKTDRRGSVYSSMLKAPGPLAV